RGGRVGGRAQGARAGLLPHAPEVRPHRLTPPRRPPLPGTPMKFRPDRLCALTAAVFEAAGCQPEEAERVASHLVEANLVGHDSHGVIRVPTYVRWLREGKVVAGRTARVVFENEAIAVLDGQFGFGQTVGAQAVRL